jgi:hypothetical protein
MATGDYKFIQENGSGGFDEKAVVTVANKYLGFDGSKNPAMLDGPDISATSTSTLTNKTLTDSVNNVSTPGVNSVGYLGMPQNSQSAAYELVLTDAGKHILHPSADTSARTFTIPANSSVAFPIGTAVTFINQNGGGAITIAITTDTMRLAGAGTTGSRTLAANGIATAVKVTSTEWLINGVNLT